MPFVITSHLLAVLFDTTIVQSHAKVHLNVTLYIRTQKCIVVKIIIKLLKTFGKSFPIQFTK